MLLALQDGPQARTTGRVVDGWCSVAAAITAIPEAQGYAIVDDNVVSSPAHSSSIPLLVFSRFVQRLGRRMHSHVFSVQSQCLRSPNLVYEQATLGLQSDTVKVLSGDWAQS